MFHKLNFCQVLLGDCLLKIFLLNCISVKRIVFLYRSDNALELGYVLISRQNPVRNTM